MALNIEKMKAAALSFRRSGGMVIVIPEEFLELVNRLEKAENDKAALMDVVSAYRKAGIGNSTDFDIQETARIMAVKAFISINQSR